MGLCAPLIRTSSATEVEYVCSATMFRHQYASVALRDLGKALQPIAGLAARVLKARE